MLEAGGLIKLHYHSHFDVLEAFSDISGVLYYKDSPLFQNIQLSQREHNHLVKQSDGLFVDGTFLDRFDYHDQELYFDDVIVSREYKDEAISTMIDTLWLTNPYLEIGKIDLSYWFELIYATSKIMIYQNNSDMPMNILIDNPNNQLLKISTGDTTINRNSERINVTLLPEQRLNVQESTNEDLQSITITLQ
jgi:hypothetical protein